MSFLPLVSARAWADNEGMDALSTTHPILSFRTRREPVTPRPASRADVVDLLAEAHRYVAQLPVVRGRRSRTALVSDLEAVALSLDGALRELAADAGIDPSCTDRACLADELARRRRITPPARDAIDAVAPVLRAALAGDLDGRRDEVADIVDRVKRYLELRIAFG